MLGSILQRLQKGMFKINGVQDKDFIKTTVVLSYFGF